MTTAILAGFLAVHGLLHLAIWLPKPSPDPAKPPPFEPDHSAILTAARVPVTSTHAIAVGLAGATAVAYLAAAATVTLDDARGAAALACAALLGLLLKALYFHPWLSLGVAIDVLALSVALTAWPTSLP